MSYVRVLDGVYAGKPVSNVVLPLVKPFKLGTKGGYITVDGAYFKMDRNIRIMLASPKSFAIATVNDYLAQKAPGSELAPSAIALASAEDDVAVVHEVETDEEVIARIRERFSMLDEMTEAVVEGNIRAMIVSGPPGVGKSFGVEKIIDKSLLFDRIAKPGARLRAEVIKGAVTPVALYSQLYKYSDEDCVLVFDDCDTVLLDDVSLNLLKGALDSGKRRKISWLADSSFLNKEGIPDSFDFKGSIIFISNLKFDKFKGKLADHLAALQSRCHYLDLTLDTMRDKIMRIKQIHDDGGLFDDLGLTEAQGNEVIAFMDINKEKLREVSLRMAIKIGQLRKSFDAKWMHMAKATCMKA
jgi:predicted AAA+ superfamily ATPase